MRYIESPTEQRYSSATSLFLAGGITGCPDWQQEVVSMLFLKPVAIFNPRRKNFPIDDPTASVKQIDWEFRYLRSCAAISFWFPCETLCPIVLYELGAWSMTSKPIFVGVHPDYKRKSDVEIQTSLVRKDVEVVYSLEDLVGQIVSWVNKETFGGRLVDL